MSSQSGGPFFVVRGSVGHDLVRICHCETAELEFEDQSCASDTANTLSSNGKCMLQAESGCELVCELR